MLRRLAALGAISVAASGCATPDDGCRVRLGAATSEAELQTALIDAPAGATVCLAAGTYPIRTELSIATRGVTLRGAGRDDTVLDFAHQDLGGNGMQIFADGVTIEALTVRDTPGDGIRATSVAHVTFRDAAVRWTAPASLANGAYGFYPVGCDGVRIERCLVEGARDAGIYVGQSRHVLVADSEAFGNVAGIELENTSDGEVRGCHAHDNTAGILVFNLPDLPVQGGKNDSVHDNLVENNNLPNFAAKGTIVSKVPAGTGMILLAASENELHHNEVRGNHTTGIVMVSYIEALFGNTDDAKFDPIPKKNFVHDNRFAANGDKPESPIKEVAGATPAPDVLWDGCTDPKLAPQAQRNCLENNGAARYLNAALCGGAKSSDPGPVTCSYPPLPGQDP
jgi:parallel beta-helix repeat protein